MDMFLSSTPIDTKPPNVLLQRYDSFSTSSGSNRSSLSSSQSRSSSQGRGDRSLNRRNYRSDNMRQRDHSANGREINDRTQISEPNDNDDSCLLCDSVVNERQYYMWQSDYVKSSYCSRCIKDSNSLQYISYWGTSCYKSGSWRERYKDGRSNDIDITPLLEVLDRIDMMDTSICGIRSKRTNVSNTIPDNTTSKAEVPSMKPVELEAGDFKLSERRQRRLRNRASLTINDCEVIHTTQRSLNDKRNSVRNRAFMNQVEVKRCEPSGDDAIEVIEPLSIERAEEVLVQHDPPNATPIADRQTSYDDFVAGLSDNVNFTRKSTIAHDLKDLRRQRRKSVKTERSYRSRHVDDVDVANANQLVAPQQLNVNENNNDKSTEVQSSPRDNETYFTETSCHNTDAVLCYKQKSQCLKTDKPKKRNVDKVLSYKRKDRKTEELNSIPRRGRRCSRPTVQYQAAEELIATPTNVENLNFSEKRKMFESMQSNDKSEFQRSTARIDKKLNHKTQQANRPKDETSFNIENKNESDITNSDNNTITNADSIECDSGNIGITDNNIPSRKTDRYHEPQNAQSPDDIGYSPIEEQINTDNVEFYLENIDTNESISRASSEKADANQEDEKSDDSESSLDESDTSSSTTDNDDASNGSPTTSNPELTLGDSLVDSATISNNKDQNECISKVTERLKERRRRRSVRRQSILNSLEDYNKTSSNTNECSDVPHIERIKKKLGRLRDKENVDDDDKGHDDFVELDTSDNDHKELSWRTRGYNADFFMSRKSVTGAEIIDRYNRALSKRRMRKRNIRNKPSYNTSTDLDELVTQSEHASRKQSVAPTKHASSAPLTRNASSIQMIQRGDEKSDKPGVSPRALTAALARAQECSSRLSQRLREQLNESSCDSC